MAGWSSARRESGARWRCRAIRPRFAAAPARRRTHALPGRRRPPPVHLAGRHGV